jgi:hypothetical protein
MDNDRKQIRRGGDLEMRFMLGLTLLALVLAAPASARPAPQLSLSDHREYLYGDNTTGCATTSYDWSTKFGYGDMAPGATVTGSVCAIENEGFARPVYVAVYSTSRTLRVVMQIGDEAPVVVPPHAEGQGNYGYNAEEYVGGYPGASEREDVTLMIMNTGKSVKGVSASVTADRIY